MSIPGVGREVGLREASGTCPSPVLLWKAAVLCPPRKLLVFPEKTGTRAASCNPALNIGTGVCASALDVAAVCTTA